MPQTNQNSNQSNNNTNKVVKVSGYAKRKFFDGGIEYRDFSDDLVGLQLTDDGGTPLFTLGNFKVTTNLSPKLNKTYNQGTYSDFFSLEDLDSGEKDSLLVQKKQKAGLNLDITNPLSYILYGSAEEKIRVSLENINKYFPAAIYVDNTVGSITGNNITNYSYDSLKDESSFTLHTNYFSNPFGIEYTIDRKNDNDDVNKNQLRNLTLNFKNYVVEHNGISKKIISFSGSTVKTNTTVKLVVEGNPFPEITGLNFSQFSFLNSNSNASIPFFIKPNELKIEDFFSGLNNLEKNLLNRNVYPIYTATFSSPKETNQGVIVYSEEKLTFPILNDGYNLNFFDGIYITYLNNLIEIGSNLDKFKTDIIKRKYTAEVITGFDTIPKGDGSDDLEIDGAKANKLLRIYGVEFDEVKKYIDGIKFAHVVNYDKKNNTPDTLVKDLANMLGFGEFNFLTDVNILKNVLPSNGGGLLSGTSTNLSLEQIDIELYRRLIVNVAWLWKSKGARKAIEFLFRFIGAPESLVNFDEYIVIANKPVNIPQLKSMLYVYTGSSDLKDLPFDENGYPLPTPNGERVLIGFDNNNEPVYDTTWFQKAGGWYRETGGLNPPIDITEGNNPHQGTYDGGSFYMNQFLTSIYPNQVTSNFINLTGNTIYQNQFINYNNGFINGTTDDDILFITTVNPINNQIIEEGVEVEFSVVPSPPVSGGTTLFQDLCNEATQEYNQWIEEIKENCELVYSPEWYRVQQNYIIAKNNLNREINSRNGNKNEALEICINIDCENIEVIENPCDLYTMVEDDGLIYFTDSTGNQVNFDAFPTCCVAAGGEYYTYINQNDQESFFCANEAPCIGKPVTTNGEAVVWEIEGVNAVPDNIIEIRPDDKPIPKYENKCLNQAKRINFSSEQERIKYLTDCTSRLRKEMGVGQSNGISGCFQLTEAGEYYFGFKVKENSEEFNTRISRTESPYVVYDKNNNPVGYIPETPGISLFSVGVAAINYVKSRKGVVYPNYEKQFNQTISNNPQNVLDKYLESARAGKIVPNFDVYFQPIDCGGKSTTLISSEECCAYYGFNHYYVNLKDEEGNITTVVYCQGNSMIEDDVELPNEDTTTRPNEDIIGRPNSKPPVSGKGDLYNPQKGLEKEIKKINKVQKSVTEKINNDRTITTKERSKLRLEKINLEQQKIDLSTQKQKLEVKNTRSIKPAMEKGYTKYVPGSNINAVTSKGEEISVIKDRKGVYNKNIKGNLGEKVTTDFGSPFGNPNLTDVTNWKFSSVDQYGRITFTPVDRNSNQILNWESTADSGADLYKECCLSKGYAFGEFQINPATNELVPYNGQPNSFTNGATFDACIEPTHIPCGETKDIKLIFGTNGSDGFFLPENTDSNEVTIKFDYMIKYNAESLINCAGIEVCPVPLDLYTNSIYNLDCRNFIVFTESEEYKNILEKNVLFIDTDILPTKGEDLDTTLPDKDGIPNLIPYWDTNNIQVWQTPGIQQTIEENGECCTAYGGQYVSKDQWSAINDENVKSIKNDFRETVKIIYREGSQTNNLPNWVDNDFKTVVSSLLLNTEEVQNILSDGCLDYQIFVGQNYCDDFDKIITTSKVCALLVPDKLGGYSEVLKEYWRLINQLKLMGEELTICVDRDKKLGELIKKVDKERINEEVDKEKKKGESRKSEINIETEYSVKEREYRNIEKQINDITEITIAIDTVKEENLPKINCNIYQEQIKIIQNFNVDEFCRTETNNVSDNPDIVFTAYNTCVERKKIELGEELKKYQELFQNCVKSNVISDEITKSTINNDTVTKDRLTTEYDVTLKNIENLQATVFCEDINEQNEQLRVTTEQENNIQKNIDIVAKILDVESNTIRKGNTTDLSVPQKIEINRVLNTQKNVKNKLNIKKEEIEKDLKKLINDKEKIKNEFKVVEKEKEEILTDIKNVKDNLIKELGDTKQSKCCSDTLEEVEKLIEKLIKERSELYLQVDSLYQQWYFERYDNYISYVQSKMATSFEYMDELRVSFNLEVDNNQIGSIPPNDIVTNLTTLPIMGTSNPIWTFTPQNYSGVVIGGSQYYSNLLRDSITMELINQGYSGLDAVFEPKWQNFEMKLPQNVIENLNGAYPNKQFFLSFMLENYECDVCLLLDNIQINYKTFDILPFNNTEGNGLPELKCTIDNRKSWVYVGDSITPVNYLPDGKCQKNEVTCATPLQITEQNRLWQNLEYRYTEYDFNHSDLIINSKSAAFQIDPSKSIECDVYNFWKNIDCNECPSPCTSGDSVTYEGEFLYTGGTSQSYSIPLSATSTGTMLSNCEIFNSTLENIVENIKEEYYTLTADYPSSLNASYYDLIEKGGSSEELLIVDNDCNTQTFVIGDRENLNNDQRLIVEEGDGTISLFGLYVYSGSTPYSGGEITDIISGVSAQTFNQTSGMTQECCKNLNTILSNKGKYGLGLDKNYVWDDSLSGCTWREINDGQGDCTHCGNTTHSSFTGTSSGVTCEVVNKTICVNPLDFLDQPPSKIKVKEVFDEMVQSNLINAQNRQTISGYPTLKLFYELYLKASNCGEQYSGKLTYNNLFQFMDLIGDYWLELIEQVIPSTTIMEGCDNSGKVYRNTIFDNNKFVYKKYVLNYLDETDTCNVSGVTDNSIGQETVDFAVEEICLGGSCLPQDNNECQENIIQTQQQITDLQAQLETVTNQISAVQLAITTVKNDIKNINSNTNNTNNTIINKETKEKENKINRENIKQKEKENQIIKETIQKEVNQKQRENKAREKRNVKEQVSKKSNRNSRS